MALPVLSVATLSFALAGEVQAQQPPAWSPQPYAKPQGIENAAPANSLRESASQAKDNSNSGTTAVARWRKIEQAAEPRARSYNNAFSPAATSAKIASAEAPIEMNDAAGTSDISNRTQPASRVQEQSDAPVVRRNAVTPARKVTEVQNDVAAHVSNGKQLDTPNNIQLVSAVGLDAETTVRQANRSAQNSAGSSRRGAVSLASYQDVSEPPSLRLPPSQSLEMNSQSPSDRQRADRREQASQEPSTYRRPTTQSSTDCDALREAIENADITKIRIDTSPSFVEGYRLNRQQSSKESFVQEAENRAWHNLDGMEVANGRLVDMGYGAVVIEQTDGTKVTYLLSKLSEADHAYVAEAWGIPVTCNLNDGTFDNRDFVATTMTWKASGACHKPLYFEEVQLERYGHEWGPVAQPAISSLNFVKNVVFLPYKMGIHPMNECQYSLGYYRPGSCAPWTVGPVPISLRGAAAQAAVVGGAAWALP